MKLQPEPPLVAVSTPPPSPPARGGGKEARIPLPPLDLRRAGRQRRLTEALRGTIVRAILLALSACASLPIAPRGPFDAEAAYTALYPDYLEFCALSEVLKHSGYGADIRGGIGGHSTMYLNGACLKGEGYPDLALCPDGDATDGVGLSVNDHFANANWVAIPGRNFFYHGDLKPGEKLTRAVYDATKAHAKRLGIYDAIRFHRRAYGGMPAGYDRDGWKYEVSIATDYAIGYGRERYCARVPLSRVQMGRVIDYLNAINRPYRDGTKVYEWSVLTDNCIHLAHNALAAAGFWKLWPTHQFVLFAAFSFPVPKNEFVNIMRRANDMKIADFMAMWNEPDVRRAVLEGDGLPTRDGALAVLEPMAQENDLYQTKDLKLIFYDEPNFGHYEERYRQIVAQPRYYDMIANRTYFADLYASIERERQPLESWIRADPDLASHPDFAAFYGRYYETIARHAAFLANAARSGG